MSWTPALHSILRNNSVTGATDTILYEGNIKTWGDGNSSFLNGSLVTDAPMLNESTTINSTLAPTMDQQERDAQDFIIGLTLAVISAVFTGSSFIFKKLGLLRYAKKVSMRASKGGFGYLREWLWWMGMILMTFGELTNFAAYAFAPATLVTPLGALSVIVSAILAARVLKDKLNILGKIGCLLCVLGSTLMVIHSPKEQEVHYVDELVEKMKEPAFIVYVVAVVLVSVIMIFYFVPRYGEKNVLVYITVCATLGSFTVMACKGLGTAIKATANGHNEFTNWPVYLLIAVVLVCILVQLNYLNKALDSFNAAVVIPIYYVFFTACVITGSAILFQEFFNMSAMDIVGDLCGFLVIVSGIFLLNAFKEMKVSWRNIPTVNKESVDPEDDIGNGVNVNGVTSATYLTDTKDMEERLSRHMSSERITLPLSEESDVDAIENNHSNDRFHGSSPVQIL